MAKRSLNSPQASKSSLLIFPSWSVAQALILNPAPSLSLHIDSNLTLFCWFYLVISKCPSYPHSTLPRPPSSPARPVAAFPVSTALPLPSPVPSPCSTCCQGDPSGLHGLLRSLQLPSGSPGCSLTQSGPSLSKPSHHTENSPSHMGVLMMKFWSTVPLSQSTSCLEVIGTTHFEVVP